MRKGFTERRETRVELVIADVFGPGNEQGETTEVAQSRKVFSRIPWEVSHSMLYFVITTGVRQRTNVLEEMNLGPRVDDAVHPSLVVVLADRDRGEEAPLAGSCPPSSHQSACGQNPPSLAGYGYIF